MSFRESWGARLDSGLVLCAMDALEEDTCRAVDGGFFSERKSEVSETNSGEKGARAGM